MRQILENFIDSSNKRNFVKKNCIINYKQRGTGKGGMNQSRLDDGKLLQFHFTNKLKINQH